MKHPTLLWSRPYHLGLRHLREGDHAAAERELTEAVRVAERLSAPDDRLGCSLAALAELCRAERRFPEAERLLRRALAVETRALGPAHPFTVEIARAHARLLAPPPPTAVAGHRCRASRSTARRAPTGRVGLAPPSAA